MINAHLSGDPHNNNKTNNPSSYHIRRRAPAGTGDAATATSGNWKLVWFDEFDGDAPDVNKWVHEVNCFGGGNNEQQEDFLKVEWQKFRHWWND